MNLEKFTERSREFLLWLKYGLAPQAAFGKWAPPKGEAASPEDQTKRPVAVAVLFRPGFDIVQPL